MPLVLDALGDNIPSYDITVEIYLSNTYLSVGKIGAYLVSNSVDEAYIQEYCCSIATEDKRKAIMRESEFEQNRTKQGDRESAKLYHLSCYIS